MIKTTKPKIPKGISYVLKTSQLEESITENGLDFQIELNYWIPESGGSILEGHYWLPNDNVPYPRVYVRAGVVPSNQRKSAQDKMATIILPAFVEWLKKIAGLPGNSPILHNRPYFNATYLNGKVLVSHNLGT